MRLDERMLKPPSKVFLPIVYAFCQTMRCLAELFCHSAILPEATGDCEIMPLTLPRSEKKRLSNNPNKRKPQVKSVSETCQSQSLGPPVIGRDWSEFCLPVLGTGSFGA